MDDYLSKPIEDIQLYRTLLLWLPAAGTESHAASGGSGGSSGPAAAEAAAADGEVVATAPTTSAPDSGADAGGQAASDAGAGTATGSGGQAAASAAGGELPDSLPGIDVATGLRYVANKPDLYKRTADRFFDRYSACTAELRELLAARDRDGAHRWAHSLKNLAGTLGATTLRERAFEVERALSAADDAEPDVDIQALDSELWRVIGSLAELLDKPQPAPEEPAPDRAQTGS
jgi:HPt (histidine-containing phosphotransfer) domain-containing protein